MAPAMNKHLIDTERLINEVRLRPALWEASHDSYKNSRAKKEIWQAVCSEVIKDYQELSRIERLDAFRAVQQRWKTARDAYMRYKASLENQKPGHVDPALIRKYVYSDSMTFLDCCRRHSTATKESAMPTSSTKEIAASILRDWPSPEKPLGGLIDPELLISEVQVRPALWNKWHNDYQNRNLRKDMWHDVSCKVIPDYSNLKPREKVEADRVVQLKWNGIRDTYIRSRKTTKKSKSKKYIYGDFLKFLDISYPVIDDSMITPAISSTPPISEGPSSPISQSSSSSCSSPTPKVTIHSQPSTSSNKQPLKRKQKQSQTCQDVSKFTNQAKGDDDMYFLVSLLPILNEYSDYQKLLFRSEVLKIAMNISNQSRDKSLGQSSLSAHLTTDPLSCPADNPNDSSSEYEDVKNFAL